MRKLLATALLIFGLGAGAAGAEEKVVVGGSGGLTEEMQELAKAYMAKHPGDKIEVIAEAMSTTGGLEGLKSGRLTIGLVTRAPKDEEKSLVLYRVVGRAIVGVGVNRALAVTGLSEAQLCDVFSGRIKSWKEAGGGEGKITVLARKADDNNEQILRAKIACLKDLKITPDAIMLVRGNELMDGLERRPGTIGMVSGGSSLGQRPNVKLLALGGAAPTAEAVQSGKYKFYIERGIITLGAPQGATKRLLDFAATPEGQKILSLHGMIPVL
ncbi:MAG TPA: substrate-binding domain-containing protein [Candidatus Binatia bacterium]